MHLKIVAILSRPQCVKAMCQDTTGELQSVYDDYFWEIQCDNEI